ncbi:hypothetical protein ACIPY5_07720 [Microbacterium sp. NPDC089698]|uniref:hypothetical protein n=1 Tax=Microbacterium sp. NPDC089698 TaxID=3364200 RepID=UPI003823F88B
MSEHKNVTRRTLVKGAAWSLPVVAAAVAVPASSASVAGPKVVVTRIAPSAATVNRDSWFTTQVCIKNQGTATAPAADNVVWVDYADGLINTSTTVLQNGAGWVMGSYQSTPGGRMQIPLTYAADLAPGQEVCVTLGQYTAYCAVPAPSGYANATLYGYGSSSAAAALTLATSPNAPTIWPVGVTNYPNEHVMDYDQISGSTLLADAFQMYYQVINPGNTPFNGPQTVYVDLPNGWTPSLASGSDGRFAFAWWGASPDHAGYTRWTLTWNGILRPNCSSGDVGVAYLQVGVAAGTAVNTGYNLYSTVYGPNGVVQTSAMYVFP